jgi:hypothetical protein
MPQDLAPKAQLEMGDIRVNSRADLTAIVWRDKGDTYMLTNNHIDPTEGNFCTKGE